MPPDSLSLPSSTRTASSKSSGSSSPQGSPGYFATDIPRPAPQPPLFPPSSSVRYPAGAASVLTTPQEKGTTSLTAPCVRVGFCWVSSYASRSNWKQKSSIEVASSPNPFLILLPTPALIPPYPRGGFFLVCISSSSPIRLYVLAYMRYSPLSFSYLPPDSFFFYSFFRKV